LFLVDRDIIRFSVDYGEAFKLV